MTSLVSTNNSTTLNLSVGQSFQGTYEPVLEYSQISVLSILGANQRATLTVYFSLDDTGTNTISKSTIVGPSDSYEHIFEIVSKYYRITVTANQGTAVTGNVHVIHHLYKTKSVSNFLNETITDSHSCEISRSLLTGATLGKFYRNVNTDVLGPANALMVSVRNPASAFGELKNVEPTMLIQVTGTYNYLNPQLFQEYKYDPLGSPITNVFCENTKMTARASSNEGAYAILKSRRQCIYRAGQGLCFRFAGFFPEGGASNTIQMVGFGNRGNGVYFGYSNTTFGVMMRTRGRAPIYTAHITNGATAPGNVTITLNDIPFNVPVTASGGNASFTAYEIAKFAYASNNHTLWNAQSIGDSVFFTYFNSASNTGTHNFNAGATGLSATISLTSAGRNFDQYFYPQSSWTVDPMNGTGPSKTNVNFTQGNVYQIQMQWLGYGRISCFMEDSAGGLQQVHDIQYANSNQVPSLELPHGAITLLAETIGPNATINPTCQFSSLSAQVEGKILRHPPMFSATGIKTLAGATETNILALSVRNNYRLFSTVAELYFSSISFTVDAGNSAVTFRIYLNPTISPTASTTDFPNFQYVNEADSIAVYDTTSHTLSGGSLIYQCSVSKDSSFQLAGELLDKLFVGKDDTVVFTAKGNNNTVNISAVWYEEK